MYIYILGGVYMYVRVYVCYLNPGGDDVEIWNLISRNTYRLLRSRHRHCKITKKSIRKRKEKTKRRKQIELSQKTLTAIRNTLTVMAGMAVCVWGLLDTNLPDAMSTHSFQRASCSWRPDNAVAYCSCRLRKSSVRKPTENA